jgi:hypothetical protein
MTSCPSLLRCSVQHGEPKLLPTINKEGTPMAPSFVWLNLRVCCRCACSTPRAKIGRGWGPRTSTPPREARVADPGPTACRIALMFRLPRPYPSSRFARLGNGPGLTSSAPNGAGFSRRLSLRGYRLLFLREYTKEHKVRLPFRQIRIRYFCCRQNGPTSGSTS